MSLERARANCLRCYSLAQYIKKTKGIDEDHFIHSDQIYLAMNNAMKALEDCIREGEEPEKADDMLKRCTKDCYFNEGLIAKSIDYFLGWSYKYITIFS